MIFLESKYIPPKGYKAMSLFGICIHRKDASKMNDKDFIHEEIHAMQQRDTEKVLFILSLIACVFIPSIWWFISAILGHLLLYNLLSVIYFCIGWSKYGFNESISKKCYYYDNPLEREAYANEKTPIYLAKRYPFSWFKYLKDGE